MFSKRSPVKGGRQAGGKLVNAPSMIRMRTGLLNSAYHRDQLPDERYSMDGVHLAIFIGRCSMNELMNDCSSIRVGEAIKMIIYLKVEIF